MSIAKRLTQLPIKLLWGPLTFCAAILSLLIKQHTVPLFSALLALISLYITCRYKKRGFIALCFLWIISSGFAVSSKQFSLWDIALTLGFVTSWYLTYKATEEVEAKLLSDTEEMEAIKVEALKIQHNSQYQEKSSKEKIEKLEAYIQELEATLQNREPHISKHDFEQLRKQFEEKALALQETRRALFHKENALFTKEKEQQEQLFSEDEVGEVLKEILQEKVRLYEENLELHNLLDSLLKVKKPRYPRMKPLKKKKGELSFLDEKSI